MFIYLFYMFVLFLISFLYTINTHLIIKENIGGKYNKWRKLNSLVSTRESVRYKIFIKSMQILLHTLYISFIQYMNTSIRKLDGKTFELTYVIEGKIYKLIIVPKRGPAPVLQVIDETNDDVTDYILPYMGPKYNWHNNEVKPSFFNYQSLSFQLMDGTEKTYNYDEIMK